MKLMRYIAIFVACASFILLLTGGVLLMRSGPGEIHNWFLGWDWEEAAGERSKTEQTVSLQEARTLSLHVNAAKLTVTTAEAPELQITVLYDAGLFSAKEALTVRDGADTVRVHIQQRDYGSTGRWVWPSVRGTRITQVMVTLPQDFTGRMELYTNACKVDAQLDALSGIRVEANACALDIRGISGTLDADVNACDGSFAVRRANGDIRLDGNACQLTLALPRLSNFNVSNSAIFGDSRNTYATGDPSQPQYQARVQVTAGSARVETAGE